MEVWQCVKSLVFMTTDLLTPLKWEEMRAACLNSPLKHIATTLHYIWFNSASRVSVAARLCGHMLSCIHRCAHRRWGSAENTVPVWSTHPSAVSKYQGCILSPCLFNLYAEYLMRNSGLEEAQTGIKIAGSNINNLRYADDTFSLMAESEEELKSLLMKVKESEVGLKLNMHKRKIMASGPNHFMANRWGNSGNSVRLHFLGLQNHCRWWLQPWN